MTNFSTDVDRSDKEKWALDFFKEKLLTDWFTPTLSPGVVQGQPAVPGAGNAGNPGSAATRHPAGHGDTRPAGPAGTARWPAARPAAGTGCRAAAGSTHRPVPGPPRRHRARVPRRREPPAPTGTPPPDHRHAAADDGDAATDDGDATHDGHRRRRPPIPRVPPIPPIPAVPPVPGTTGTAHPDRWERPPRHRVPVSRARPRPGSTAGHARPVPGTPGQPAPHQADAGTPEGLVPPEVHRAGGEEDAHVRVPQLRGDPAHVRAAGVLRPARRRSRPRRLLPRGRPRRPVLQDVQGRRRRARRLRGGRPALGDGRARLRRPRRPGEPQARRPPVRRGRAGPAGVRGVRQRALRHDVHAPRRAQLRRPVGLGRRAQQLPVARRDNGGSHAARSTRTPRSGSSRSTSFRIASMRA